MAHNSHRRTFLSPDRTNSYMSERSSQAKIVVDAVGKSYPADGHRNIVALDRLSFSVRSGEFLTLLGPNGCGKTTALKIMGGILPVDDGRVLVDGKQVVGPSFSVALVFQELSLFTWKTCEENVEFGLKARGIAPSARKLRVRKYLELLGLGSYARMFPAELSGGIQQRVTLAQTLVLDPDVLLLDEPFRSLDTQTTELMEELLLKLWQQSTRTVVLVSHSVDEAVFLSDRIIVMTSCPGRIATEVEVGLPRPRTPDLRVSQEFTELRRTVWNALRSQFESSDNHEGAKP